MNPEGQDIIVKKYFFAFAWNADFNRHKRKFQLQTRRRVYRDQDSFQYLLLDEDGNYSEQVTVTIEVTDPFNRKPVGMSDQFIAYDGTELSIATPGLLSNDFDPDEDGIIVFQLFCSITWNPDFDCN